MASYPDLRRLQAGRAAVVGGGQAAARLAAPGDLQPGTGVATRRSDRRLRRGDHRADDHHPAGHGPAAAVPARHPEKDDGGAAKARARGRRAAEEIQEGPAKAERRDDEALPGARRQPAWRFGRLPPPDRPDPDPDRSVLRAHRLRPEQPRGGSLLVHRQSEPEPDAAPLVLGDADTEPRIPRVPSPRGHHHAGAVADVDDAAAAQPDRPGAANGADAADDGLAVAVDDRLLRAERSSGPRALLVYRELRQYHSAELRSRLGKCAAGPVQADCCRGIRREKRTRAQKGPTGSAEAQPE